MTNYAIMDGQYPVSLGASDRVPDGVLMLPDDVDVAIYARKWLVGEEWQDRPTLTPPRAVNGTVVHDEYPEGTEVIVTPLWDQVVEVEVLPPRPWLPLYLRFDLA